VSDDGNPLHYRPEDSAPARPPSRRKEIERFIRTSGLPGGERAVIRDLLNCADNATGLIRAEHDWKTSLALIADRVGFPKSNVILWLDHLERHRIVRRHRSAGGQGHRTRYVLLPPGAEACTCPSRVRDEPKPAAQRMREMRRRKRLTARNAQSVTAHRPFEGSVARNENVVSPAAEHLGIAPRREVPSLPGNDLALCRVCGESLDPVLPAAGFTTHPGCDPDEVSALLTEWRR
jgi:hypothetical protein